MKPDSTAQNSWEIQFLTSPVDGIRIRYAVKKGDSSKRAVVFLNGRSEYIEKYQDLPDDTDFSSATWVMMDHRGQGASEGPRSHVRSYDDFARDTQAVIQEALGTQPYVLIAHSMGGLISLYGTLKSFLKPEALVLCSPLFGILAPIPMALARFLAKVLALTPIGSRSSGASVDRRASFEGNILTHSKERFEKMSTSPYKGSSPTFGWINATFRAFATISNKDLVKTLKIPVGIIVGDKEQVVDRMAYAGWIKMREELNGEKTAFELVPNANHELLNEWDEYRNPALKFINQRLKL